MNISFLRAINDIKKQKNNETQKKEVPQEKQPIDEKDDISSDEAERLKSLGVYKKKIHKQVHNKDNKWKHDRFKKDEPVAPVRAKPPSGLSQLSITFLEKEGYQKIFPIIKHLKIYVREINDQKIIFNKIEAYQQASRLYKKNGFQFIASLDKTKTQQARQ